MILTSDSTTRVVSNVTVAVDQQAVGCKIRIESDLVIIHGRGAGELFLRLLGGAKKEGEG